jgi:circadian clock protein KaiC
MYRSPIDVYLEEWFYELIEAIDRTSAQRVLIDGLADLRLATTDELRFREYLYSLLQICTVRGVSLMLTLETTPERFADVSRYGISNLSDNVVLLELARAELRYVRSMAVLKTRASDHDPAVREFRITKSGIVLQADAGTAA